MNAMLEPRIVAARTHGAADGAQGESQAAARTTPLSDGGVEKALIACRERSNQRQRITARLPGDVGQRRSNSRTSAPPSARRQLDCRLALDRGAIAGGQALRSRRRAARDLHPRLALGCIACSRFRRHEHRRVDFYVLMNVHGAVAAVGRDDEAQLAALLGVVECLLLVAGRDSLVRGATRSAGNARAPFFE